MAQLCSFFPGGELLVCVDELCRDHFYGSTCRVLSGSLGQKYGIVIRGSEILVQGKPPVDDVAFPLFPAVSHFSVSGTVSDIVCEGKKSCGACRQKSVLIPRSVTDECP